MKISEVTHELVPETHRDHNVPHDLERGKKFSVIVGWGLFDKKGDLVSLIRGRGEKQPVLAEEAHGEGYSYWPLWRPVI